jgi:UDP-2,3-diacylglucosamine pyrophosphatase LpxH
MKLAIVIPDIHVPYHDAVALKVICKVIKTLAPDYLIVLGDSLDFYQLSKFDKDPLRKTTVSSDVTEFRHVLHRLDGACPMKTEKVFLEGNHEHRLQKWIWSNATELGNMIPSLESYCGFKGLGWRFFKYGKFYRLGPVLYMHGDRCGMNVSMNMIRKYGCSVVHGHDHGAAIRYFANAVDRMWAMNCGHLSDMNQQEYLYGGVADWTTGFGLVEYSNDLTVAHPSFVPIIDGKCHVWGQLYK